MLLVEVGGVLIWRVVEGGVFIFSAVEGGVLILAEVVDDVLLLLLKFSTEEEGEVPLPFMFSEEALGVILLLFI